MWHGWDLDFEYSSEKEAIITKNEEDMHKTVFILMARWNKINMCHMGDV